MWFYGELPSTWKSERIGDYAEVITDYVANGSFASLAENVEYKDDPDYAVLIRLTDYNNDFNGKFVYINQSAYEFLGKSKLFGGEIIISNVGANVGTVFRCPQLDTKMSLAPNAIMLKTKGDDDFYYYWFSSRNGQHSLKSIVTGSAQPKFNKTNFRDLLVPVPPIDVQRKISTYLRTIDEKITLNKQINNNLLEQANAIFKREFLELSELPDGWYRNNLTSIANYLNGLAMQKYRPTDTEIGLPVLKIKELRQGFCDSDSELCSPSIKSDYIINNGDVIFSWSGSLLVDFWCGGQCGLNQHLFKVTSDTYDPWFYFAWTNYHLAEFAHIAASKATTMGHIKRNDLEKAIVVIPSQEDYARIGEILSPIYKAIVENRLENNKLTQLRDTLLLQLMSGELDISTIEI